MATAHRFTIAMSMRQDCSKSAHEEIEAQKRGGGSADLDAYTFQEFRGLFAADQREEVIILDPRALFGRLRNRQEWKDFGPSVINSRYGPTLDA
jgi:hypothetical protein